MIGLGIRKIVDRSSWDQSFVDGGNQTGRHRKTSSGAWISDENGTTTTRRIKCNRREPEVSDQRLPFTSNLPETEMNTYEDGGMDSLANVAAERTSRKINPFLDDACQQVQKFCLAGDEMMLPLSSSTASDAAATGQPRGRDLDKNGNRGVDSCSCRKTSGLAMGDVAAWLDSLELFEASRLRLNRSTSSSPPVFDRDKLTLELTTTTSSGGQSNDRGLATDKQTPASLEDQVAPRMSEVPESYSLAMSFLPSWDLERLETVYSRLDASGFYFGRMSMEEARRRLTGYPVGTFLLRDSSDRRFLFSLSVQTRRGTTSIRVIYEAGLFRLDCDPEQSHLMPTFDCILLLIRSYVRRSAGRLSSSDSSSTANSYVFRESSGRRDTPVLLRRPLETTPASLTHLCRKRIHRSMGNKAQNISRLHLKPSLKDYLALYPYDI